jgi:hypothetical protein
LQSRDRTFVAVFDLHDRSVSSRNRLGKGPVVCAQLCAVAQ